MSKDKQVLHFFSRFQTLRHETAPNIQNVILKHDDYKFPETFYGMRSIVFSCMAGDFTRGLIGELNRFVVNIHHAESWIRAANECEEGLKIGLLWEFADPFLELAIGRNSNIETRYLSLLHALETRSQN
jgi:hypothetical protein